MVSFGDTCCFVVLCHMVLLIHCCEMKCRYIVFSWLCYVTIFELVQLGCQVLLRMLISVKTFGLIMCMGYDDIVMFLLYVWNVL